jgi:biotin transport system substrate-specific component
MKSVSSRYIDFVLAAFSAVIIGVLAQVRFMLGPIPYTMQNMGVVLASLLLSPSMAFFSVALYLLLIGIGFPMASGFMGGPLVLVGYTSGYLWGFLISAPIYSWVSRKYLLHHGKSLSMIDARDSIVLLLLSALSYLPVYILGFLVFSYYALGNAFLLSWAGKASSAVINAESVYMKLFTATVLVFFPQDLLMDHVLGILLAKESHKILLRRGVSI